MEMRLLPINIANKGLFVEKKNIPEYKLWI